MRVPARLLSLLCLALMLLWSHPAWAGALQDRLDRYPNWTTTPPIGPAEGDLAYPTWFAGNWQAQTTLIDQVAPVANVTSPGFESSRKSLNQPIDFVVRFVPDATGAIVSDRAYNGLNIARAYLGKTLVLRVEVDPTNPNKQATILANDRQLISIVNGRAVEANGNEFITSEVFQQIFRGTSQPFLNSVETTTSYHREADRIVANQITAVYLSPKDPDYFKAIGKPIALYRYDLVLTPILELDKTQSNSA
jgi:hypothetical protein